jgi:poly [ADP-ribose] polymerase
MRKAIERYVKTTVGSTHGGCRVEIVDIYGIDRKEDLNAKSCPGDTNKVLLWHGTRLSNFISILQKGLMLRPESLGVYVTGKMFGYGIYGANSFSKSWNYCDCGGIGEEACLLLGEFSLGQMSQRVDSDYYITEESLKKEGCQSTWGQGITSISGMDTIDGVNVPYGPLKKSGVSRAYLQYDEFIVYNQDQVKLKYIVRVRKI